MAETNITTTNTLAHDVVPLVIRDRLLERGLETLVFMDSAEELMLPEGNGKAIQATRYERLALPNSPLTESETPTATPIVASIVQAIVDQWGGVCSMSDMSQITIKHPVLSIAQDLLGDQRAELIDREIQRVLNASSSVNYANGKASRSALTTVDVLTTNDVQKILATLRTNGARPWANGMFRGVVNAYQEQDLLADATFKQSSIQQGTVGNGSLVGGKIGSWMGVEWYRSNFIPAISRYSAVTPAANTTLNNFTGFTGSSTVRAKITKLDSRTGFETQIGDETAVTNASAFRVVFTSLTAGTYNLYMSVEDGAAGTATFQARVVLTTTTTINIAKALGTGTITASELVQNATGAVAPPDASSTVNVHPCYIFGRGAYGVTNLSALKTFLTPATPSDSDPLVQRRKAGWKQIFKALILNPNFMRRIEAASAYN